MEMKGVDIQIRYRKPRKANAKVLVIYSGVVDPGGGLRLPPHAQLPVWEFQNYSRVPMHVRIVQRSKK